LLISAKEFVSIHLSNQEVLGAQHAFQHLVDLRDELDLV